MWREFQAVRCLTLLAAGLLGVPARLAADGPTPVAALRLAAEGKDAVAGDAWVGFDPSGRYLAARYLGRDDFYVAVWDATRWEPVHSAGLGGSTHRGFIPAGRREWGPPAAFLPSGSRLVYLGNGVSRLVEGCPLGRATGAIRTLPESDDARPPFPGDSWSVWAGPGAPDLCRVGVNEGADRLVVHATSAERPAVFGRMRDIRLPAKASALALSPDHARLAWAEDPPEPDRVVSVRVRDLGSGEEVALRTGGPANRVSRLAFSPDGKRLAAGAADGVVRVFDLGTGKEAAACIGPPRTVSTLSFNPDGSLLAYGTFDPAQVGNLWVVSAKDGARVAGWAADRGGVSCVAFDPKGERLAAVGSEGVVRVYRVEDLQGRRK